MFTGAWRTLVEIIYDTTGSLFVGVYLYALLTLMEIFSLSVIIMHIAEKIRTRKRKRSGVNHERTHLKYSECFILT